MGAPIDMAREAQADCGAGHIKAFIEALEHQSPSETLQNGDLLLREPIGARIITNRVDISMHSVSANTLRW